MKYIYAIKGSAVALLIFIILVIFSPAKGPSDDLELIETEGLITLSLNGRLISTKNPPKICLFYGIQC